MGVGANSSATPASRPRLATGARQSVGSSPAPTTSTAGRPSTGGLASRTTRTGSSSVTSTPARQRSSLLSKESSGAKTAAGGHGRPSRPNGESSNAAGEEDPSPSQTSAKAAPPTRKAPAPSRAPASSSRPAQSSSAETTREIESLKTKLRVIEGKRAEDRERLRDLEMLRTERDKFEGIIQKLQAKYQPQSLEIGELRKTLNEKESKLEELERLQAENDSTLEMAALDRDMAEETAEAFKHECEILRQRVEELQLEAEILHQENEELGETMSPEERASQGWLAMEKTNERLREALLRLRDVTQQQETELKDQIKELEQDLEEYSSIKAQYESTKERLLTSENNVEDLKQQLETALGAEEMIEELADKNMRSQEEINELRSAIEDLEALKEIGDELEYNHIETEKQLQEEIEHREIIFNEQCRRVSQQDETIEDLEYTLVRFRELVSSLQGDLEDMRASKQISETESSELTTRSRAMMNLNTKLQASISKSQTKTIDVELGRLEAEEAGEHLSILKLYLPEYFDGERNSILAFLRFKRVSFKASLMNSTIRERFSSDQSVLAAPEEFFAAADATGKLLWISSICDRFVNYITGCSAEKFGSVEGAFQELEPVERTLNSWIVTLKKNEFDTKKCVDELQRSIGVLSHLSETIIPSDEPETHADEICMRSILIQTYVDQAASSISYLKTLVQSKIAPVSDDDEEGTFFFNKMDALAAQSRRLKVASGKINHFLEDLKARSLAPSSDATEPFQRIEGLALKLAGLVEQLGERVAFFVGEEERVEPFTLAEISSNMSQTSASFCQTFGLDGGDSEDALALLGQILHSLGISLGELDSISSDLSHASEFEKRSAPWIARSEKLKSNKTISPDANEAIQRLKNEVQETSTALGVKEQTIEEQAIKVELLETRMREASKKVSVVKDLESSNDELRTKESELSGTVEKQKKSLQTLEAERDDYQTRLEKMKRASGTTGVVATTADGEIVDTAMSLATMRENEALRSEIQSLQASVRYLREENRRTNLLDPYTIGRSTNMNSWLDGSLSRKNNTNITKHQQQQQQQQQQQTAQESKDVFGYLLKLTQNTQIYDLKKSSMQEKNNNSYNNNNKIQSHIAWRPAKSRLRYHVLQQREQFENWTEWRDDLVSREREQERLADVQIQKKKKMIMMLQAVNNQPWKEQGISLKEDSAGSGGGDKVEIVDVD